MCARPQHLSTRIAFVCVILSLLQTLRAGEQIVHLCQNLPADRERASTSALNYEIKQINMVELIQIKADNQRASVSIYWCKIYKFGSQKRVSHCEARLWPSRIDSNLLKLHVYRQYLDSDSYLESWAILLKRGCILRLGWDQQSIKVAGAYEFWQILFCLLKPNSSYGI
jgi:hypothetical protein